ncbi:hypothetical protein RJZ56_005184 [Blastomyces dermatitidis]
MDGVSFAAALITLTQTTAMIIRALNFYSSSLKNASDLDIPRMKHEIDSLQTVLRRLESIEKGANPSKPGSEKIALPTLKAMCAPPGGILDLCRTELESLSSRLNFNSEASSKTGRVVQQLKWPLKKKETERHIEIIRRYTENIVQSVQADQISIILDMKSAMDSKPIPDTSARCEILHQKIDGRLCAVDPSINYRRTKRKRYPGTALWFIDGECFKKWKSQSPSFCWLHGMIGSGKSVMSSVIVEHISHECSSNNLSLALAYFYFDFTTTDKLSPESMMRSLIKQLCHQNHNTDELESIYLTSSKESHGLEACDLLPILRDIMGTFKETFIVLDALDVCSNTAELLHIVKEILRGASSRVHILSTSREITSIEEEVDSLPGKVQKVPMDKSQINGDISTFTQECLRTDRRFKRWTLHPDIQRAIKNCIVSKSDGMFQFAASLLEMLGNCVDVQSLREALASPPMLLNAVYERILLDTDRKWKNHAPELLRWLAFSARPLTIAELAEMRVVDVDNYRQLITGRKLFDPREISDICSPFVKIDAAEGTCEVLELAHLSVKEYMVSDSAASGPVSQYHASASSTHAEMAGICLAYLLHFGQRVIVDDNVVSKFPLARYASRYWIHHVREAKTCTERIMALAEELLSPDNLSYSNWIRLYDPGYPWREPNYSRSKQTMCAPLYYMALAGIADLTDILLAEGINPDAYHGFYGTPLQAACAMGHVEVTKRLIVEGADVHIDEGGSGNALRLATKGGHAEIVELLLEKGADINASGPLLRDAAGKGHAYLVKRLLQKGQDPNTHDEIEGTALQLACAFGHSEVVDLLLENGADVNIRGGIYDSPLQAASTKGHVHICTQLLLKGADPNVKGDRCGGSALIAASSRCHLRIVEELVQNGATIDIVDGEGETPLQSSLAAGHESIAQLLLSKGANPFWEGGLYGNVLQAASLGGAISVVKSLISRAVDVNTFGGKYATALQAAASRGHVEIIQILIDHGAFINTEGGCYGSALHAASSKGRVKAVQLLLTCGANVNPMPGKSIFPIQEAAVHNHPRVVRLLLENGADLNSSGSWRGPRSTLELVARRGHIEVVRVILQWATDTHMQLVALEAALNGALEAEKPRIAALLRQ